MTKTTKKILVVDDEKAIVRALILKLDQANFSTKGAINGEEALELLKKEKFDLVLLDLIMPTMNGFAVLEEMAKLKIKSKVIVTSNLSMEEDMNKAIKLGAVGYLVKSNTPIAEVVEKIKQTVGA